MKNIKKFLPIFLVMMPLLMANSPSPYPHLGEYKDFTNTAIELVSSDETLKKHVYQTTITNSGEGYIELAYTNLYQHRTLITSSSDEYGFYLAPTKSAVVSFTTSSLVPSIDSLSIGCIAFSDYQIDTFATYSNPSAFTKSGGAENPPLTYSMDIELEYEKNYTYTILISYTYDETEYITREAYIGNNEDGNYIHFSDLEDFDVTKMAFKDLIFIQGREIGNSELSDILMTIVLGLIGGVIGIGILVALITLAVFGIVYVVKTSRNKKVDPK